MKFQIYASLAIIRAPQKKATGKVVFQAKRINVQFAMMMTIEYYQAHHLRSVSVKVDDMI